MWRPTAKCPACGTVLPGRQFHAGKPWKCMQCSRSFRIAIWYSNAIFWGSLALTITVCLIVGLRHLELLLAVIVLFVPVDLALTYALNKALPIPLTEINETSHGNGNQSDSILGKKQKSNRC